MEEFYEDFESCDEFKALCGIDILLALCYNYYALLKTSFCGGFIK
jgi:hypothetical protein